MEECETCKGTGAKPGTQPTQCTTCHGHGQVRMQQGFFSIQQTCPRCHGTGKMIANPCQPCEGTGRLKKHKTLSVKIPSGVDEGDRIRLSGEGEAGVNGGPSGDLYVVIHIKAHPVFTRDHNDLHCEMPISFTTAALGGDIEIPTPDGYAKIKVPRRRRAAKALPRGRIKGVRWRATAISCAMSVETGQSHVTPEGALQEFESISGKPGRPQPARQILDGKSQRLFDLDQIRQLSRGDLQDSVR